MATKIVADDKIAGRPIRLNRKTLAVKRGGASICFLGDMHYGSPQCDVPRLQRTIDYCIKNHIYAFLMGDLIEMATRDSIGAGVYEQESIGQTQYEEIVEILRPLSKAGLLVATLRGNHEARLYQACGVDIAKAIAKELDVPYLRDAGWSLFDIGDQRYTVYALHGRTGAQFDGTVLRAVENISHSFACDLLVMGHAHRAVQGYMLMQAVEHNQVVERKKLIMVTGSYLKYSDSYWATRGGRLSKLGSPIATFSASKKEINITW